jgi:hypothetical protein
MPSSPLSNAELSRLVKEYAGIQGCPGVYVLGCFARRVTLYSQQVRAFNLVYALRVTGKIDANARVAVIGAGASGLAAAGALAHLGCKVTVFEQKQEVLTLQANAVTRYIHPRIYDWPAQECLDTQARLPIFDWVAGKADGVVDQLRKNWTAVKAEKDIPAHFLVKILDLSYNKTTSTHRVRWQKLGENPREDTFHCIILAIGFGLESGKKPSKSYWSPDDLDDDFYDRRRNERWLISGLGDGALTDLMRLCILNFRYDNIVRLLEATDGIAGIKVDLESLHTRRNLSPEKLSRLFYNLSTTLPNQNKLENKLRPLLRKLGPQIFLTGKTPHLYGPGSSVLNRLIVLLLSRLGAFTWLPGPSGDPVPVDNRYRVSFEYPATAEEFDHVILRHGTMPVIGEFIDHLIGPRRKEKLAKVWSQVNPEYDRSRVREWPAGFFGVQAQPETNPGKSNQAFEQAVHDFGIKIAQLSLFKELREDGSSTVTYAVEGLTAVNQSITGLYIRLESCAGKAGWPRLDPEAERLGLIWKPDKPAPDGTEKMEELSAMVRTASGTVTFAKPLAPSDPPLTFYLTVVFLNGDALSEWELAQFYSPEEQQHVDLKPFPFPSEYFTRFVWCPVEILKMQVTLPNSTLGPIVCRTFSLPEGSEIHTDEVVQNSLVHLSPRPESPWYYKLGNWRQTKEGADLTPDLDHASPQTWTLTVNRPKVGSCYSLDWKLPGSAGDRKTRELAAETTQIRAHLADYRRTSAGAKRQLRRALIKLYSDIDALQRANDFDDPFDVELLIYNEDTRHLQLIEEVLNGKLAPKPTALWFPFGLGLGGACFKQGDAPYFYYRKLADEKKIGPEYYLQSKKTKAHKGMVSVPLLHPAWPDLKPEQRIEPSRLCIGVVDISFMVEPRWLTALRSQDDREVLRLWTVCETFGRQVHKIFCPP